MEKPYNKAEADFFIVALKEEAREILRKVGSDADPDSLINGILDELQALAPRRVAEEDRTEEEIWNQVRGVLVKAAYATRPHCVRCGTCCTEGSPTLVREDINLFTKNILKPEHVFTIREGEAVYDNRTEQTTSSDYEAIKIREVPEREPVSSTKRAGRSARFMNAGPNSVSTKSAGTLSHPEEYHIPRSPEETSSSLLRSCGM